MQAHGLQKQRCVVKAGPGGGILSQYASQAGLAVCARRCRGGHSLA